MRKTYRYKNLSFAVADNEDVHFTVEFVSDGNIGQTAITIPGDNDPDDIENEGTRLLGKGKNLREGATVTFSALSNPVPHEDEIRINYKINDKLLVEHVNLKKEEERPLIVLIIQFPNSEVTT